MAAISDSGDVNEYVIDVEVQGYCSDEVAGVSAIGAMVSMAGTCWTHVHPHTLNMYDASACGRAINLVGGRRLRNLYRVAAPRSTSPDWHGMEQWAGGA